MSYSCGIWRAFAVYLLILGCGGAKGSSAGQTGASGSSAGAGGVGGAAAGSGGTTAGASGGRGGGMLSAGGAGGMIAAGGRAGAAGTAGVAGDGGARGGSGGQMDGGAGTGGAGGSPLDTADCAPTYEQQTPRHACSNNWPYVAVTYGQCGGYRFVLESWSPQGGYLNCVWDASDTLVATTDCNLLGSCVASGPSINLTCADGGTGANLCASDAGGN